MIKKMLKKITAPLFNKLNFIQSRIERGNILHAKTLINQNKEKDCKNISDAEFKVFSQFGEDGIIQYLISKVPIDNEIFVEFGVEDYTESNTRFLLFNNNWKGLVLDGSSHYINSIKSSDYYWRHDLNAVRAFITKDNINTLIQSSGISGDIGLLSIDLDGNDYWIWERLDVISPRIVVCEYNSVFGNEDAITVPYKEDFVRANEHYSRLYFGASLKAMRCLAERKGYVFVGSNSVGVNAFFVRKDVAGNLKPVEDGYVKSKFRESRDLTGKLNYLSGDNRKEAISGLPVVNVATGEIETLK